MQLEQGEHILPDQGELWDANYILQRLGLFVPSPMGGMTSLSAGMVLDFAQATLSEFAPSEVDAALLASDAYVYENRRSDGQSTDAPWDWPKSDRDREILETQTDKAIEAIMGG